ncbi:LysR family transcriptional regulator [Pseudoduganella namucuonensis]|uniref:Transcriptional regulator, LysR family n=1 Tax=Pseudoduganella namucuonensis TaxID=1035707 RepID=A0A1I7LCP5_9BURK|nr:LysR family transcriptional regulator [Pseudoduganella namucuonensis]SFV07294.1 transcriptional regulator, LysR family [Pseudoduganella namucuonensis]
MDTKKRLDLNLLVTLETLLVEQNVTHAAERLHLSQPAVSAQLNRLRELFDDPLLIPVQRGMTPTAKAMDLLDPLRQALDQVRATLAEHRNFNPAKASLTVTIACTDYLQATVVQPLAIALRKRAPGVRIALRHLDPAELEAQMASGQVDLALMTPEHGPASLRSRHLFDERYVLIGRHRHPGLRRGLTVEQFARLDQVIVSLRGGDFTTPVDEGLAALGYKRKVALSAASFLFVPGLVAQSDFVALVPERLVRASREALKVVECPFPVPGFAVSMLWHERNHGHSGQRWVREVVMELSGQARGQ